MPEFTLKQMLAELAALGFVVERQSNGHFKVKYNGRLVAHFCESHGSRTKRGMVKMAYYRQVMRDCDAFLRSL